MAGSGPKEEVSEAERGRDSDDSRKVSPELVEQVLNVRFFEAAEQHAGSSTTKSRAKSTGCKHPVGGSAAGTAGPGEGAARASSGSLLKGCQQFRGLCALLLEVFLRYDTAPMEG